MTEEWPKEIVYQGVTVKLTQRCRPLSTDYDYGYELPSGIKGAGFLSAGAAQAGAERAVDRKLAREAKA